VNDTTNDTTGVIAGSATATAIEHMHVDATAIQQIGALSLAASSIQEFEGTAHLVIPKDFTHVDITAAIEKVGVTPRRKTSAVQLGDLASFNIYVADQGEPNSVYIYADPETRTLTAVLNDHAKDEDTPGWRDQRVMYKAELSREFATWVANDRKPMEQEQFAVFLEDNIADIVEPSGETLMTVALTLQAKTEVSFNSHRRLDNGQIQLSYVENIDARAGAGAIEIPREFTIGARLFKNGDGYKVRARLKYRLSASKVKFWYELDRAENAIEDAFQEYINQARENGFTVLIGKP
jgi:uncharacterized protein YfdQ (DUF2303 family)